MMKLSIIALILAVCNGVNADIYMHYPRGGNNRLNENTNERAQGNRLFDSQNNNRGGSNVGAGPDAGTGGRSNAEEYYAGNVMSITWVSQHSCGNNANNDCQFIVQSMCGDNVRDGTTTDRIPTDNGDCTDNNCDTDTTYGRHESLNYYNLCKMTQRNLGLYTAGQNVKGARDDNAQPGDDSPNGVADAGAIYTRQNANGNRNGYECVEERDYYPYWRSSPWVDIAVLTNTPEKCQAYVEESQNVKPRAGCAVSNDDLAAKVDTEGWIPADKEACEMSLYTWDPEYAPAHKVPQPLCRQAFNTRDNHNGHAGGEGTQGGFDQMINWTIPDAQSGNNCIVRIRYNVSSNENGGDVSAASDATFGAYGFASLYSTAPSMDFRANQQPPGNTQNAGNAAKLDVWSQFGLPMAAINPNGLDYAMRNNPNVLAFGEAGGPRFQLSINTNQFARTFEDRSHAMTIGKTRPANIPLGTPIHSINVSGKRGNIVQAYPGKEYDFVPSILHARTNDYVHIQWSGATTNPGGNAGNGPVAGEDNTNLILARDIAYPANGLADNTMAGFTYGGRATRYPTLNALTNNFLGWTADVIEQLALTGVNQNRVYTQPQMVGAGAEGCWNYLSTINDSFTNRAHRGQVCVSSTYASTASMAYAGGHVFSGRNYLRVHAGTLSRDHAVTFTGGPSNDEWESDWVNVEVYAEDQATPHQFHLRQGKESTIDLHMAYVPSPFTTPRMYRTIDGDMAEVAATFQPEHGVALAKVNHGGMHVIKSHLNLPLVIGLGASMMFIMGAVVAGSVAACRKQAKSL